jgi:hypothetical protein
MLNALHACPAMGRLLHAGTRLPVRTLWLRKRIPDSWWVAIVRSTYKI